MSNSPNASVSAAASGTAACYGFVFALVWALMLVLYMYVIPGTSQLHKRLMVEYTWHHQANGSFVYMSKVDKWASEQGDCYMDVNSSTFPNITSLYMVGYASVLGRAQALACGGSVITQYTSVQEDESIAAFERYGDLHVSRGIIEDTPSARESLRNTWEESEAQCECHSIHQVNGDVFGNYTVESFFLGIQNEYVNAVNGWHDKIEFTGTTEENVRSIEFFPFTFTTHTHTYIHTYINLGTCQRGRRGDQ
ncbi:hypothetical protein OAV88_00110 [bacterium]|nr:hypothetical protein [bacterium]